MLVKEEDAEMHQVPARDNCLKRSKTRVSHIEVAKDRLHKDTTGVKVVVLAEIVRIYDNYPLQKLAEVYEESMKVVSKAHGYAIEVRLAFTEPTLGDGGTTFPKEGTHASHALTP